MSGTCARPSTACRWGPQQASVSTGTSLDTAGAPRDWSTVFSTVLLLPSVSSSSPPQAALPSVPADTKLSKLDVLVLAADYIAHLTQTLQEDGVLAEDAAPSRPGGNLHPVKVKADWFPPAAMSEPVAKEKAVAVVEAVAIVEAVAKEAVANVAVANVEANVAAVTNIKSLSLSLLLLLKLLLM